MAAPSGPNFAKYVAFTVLGLVVGYVGGREHIKYEFRSTFQTAAAELQSGLAGAFGGGTESSTRPAQPVPSTPPAAVEEEETRPPTLRPTLQRKEWREADYLAGYGDAVTFSIAFENVTGKDIRAFDGTLEFSDLLDNRVLAANIAINKTVPDGESLSWDGELDYNQFSDEHRAFRAAEIDEMVVRFRPRKVLFADGTAQEY